MATDTAELKLLCYGTPDNHPSPVLDAGADVNGAD